jgi:Domain of unknown function (DUF397)
MHAAELGPLRWVKSSYSTNNGVCVEVAQLPAGWMKSSYSANNGVCVEVALGTDHVAVRDSKHPDGPVLLFPVTIFRQFTRTR